MPDDPKATVRTICFLPRQDRELLDALAERQLRPRTATVSFLIREAAAREGLLPEPAPAPALPVVLTRVAGGRA